jgi:hypothetical protein
MKVVVFAHTPPPHHGQSYMVQLMLEGFGRDKRNQGHKSRPKDGTFSSQTQHKHRAAITESTVTTSTPVYPRASKTSVAFVRESFSFFSTTACRPSGVGFATALTPFTTCPRPGHRFTRQVQINRA